MYSKKWLNLQHFFCLHPLFFFLLFLICGICLCKNIFIPSLLIPLFCYAQKKRTFCIAGLIIILTSFIYTLWLTPIKISGFLPVQAKLDVQEIQERVKNHKQVYRLVSQAIAYPKNRQPIKARVIHYLPTLKDCNSEQLFSGKLCQINDNYFFIQDKTQKLQTSNIKTNRTVNNFKKKQSIINKIKKHTKNSLNQDLFSHLLVALDPTDSLLYDLFTNFGLTHILVISGFHFSLLLLVVCLVLTPLIHKKSLNILLLIGSLAFFLFIGKTPSMLRAFICLCFFLTAKLFNLHIKPLNALSLAAIIALIIDPFALFTVSFQLTFLATFAILVCYNPIKKNLQKLLKKRTLIEWQDLSFIDKHLYLIKQILAKALALNIAVLIMTGPALLYHFQIIALNSLIYNLFIPPLIILILPALFICLILPSPSHAIIKIIEPISEQIIDLIYFAPTKLLPNLSIDCITPTIALVATSVFGSYFIILYNKKYP